MCEEVGILIGSCIQLWLKFRWVVVEFVPWVLTAKEKDNHLFAATDLLLCAESDAEF